MKNKEISNTHDQGDSPRCPECQIASLNTPSILVRLEKRKRENIPIKICRRCKVMIFNGRLAKKGWKVWTLDGYQEWK